MITEAQEAIKQWVVINVPDNLTHHGCSLKSFAKYYLSYTGKYAAKEASYAVQVLNSYGFYPTCEEITK